MSRAAAVACLALVVALTLAAAVCMVRSARRGDSLPALFGLFFLISAGIPATVYGAAPD